MLKEQGWVVGDRRKNNCRGRYKTIGLPRQNYKTVSETLKNDMESKYVDYLLLDRFGAPIAIIEAKRTSRDPILAAQKQAQEYANDIKAHRTCQEADNRHTYSPCRFSRFLRLFYSSARESLIVLYRPLQLFFPLSPTTHPCSLSIQSILSFRVKNSLRSLLKFSSTLLFN